MVESETPKSLFSREKEGQYIYSQEPSRCLWVTPSRSIAVYKFWPPFFFFLSPTLWRGPRVNFR